MNMGERKRDLSGFAVPPSPPGAPPQHGPPKRSGPPPPPAPVAPKPPNQARAIKKRRITLSLPTAIAARLRETAEREDRFFLDIVLDAFGKHAPIIDAELTGIDPASRDRSAGRTQIPLNIFPEDLAKVDRQAGRLNLDRSAYVAELLIRSFR